MEKSFSLNPTIPYISFPPLTGGPAEVAITVGDLNGDSIPDLVVSNELAFLRVYFLARDPLHDDLSVSGSSTIFAYPSTCSGPGDRLLTTCAYYCTRPMVYDIDLDGQNELIYLDHIPPDKVGLQVYKWNGSTQVFDRQISAGGLIDINNPLMAEGGAPYFAPNCGTQKDPDRGYHFRIVNVRGRPFPQDILVWATMPYLLPYKVFGYDSGASPRIALLFNHTKHNRPNVITDDGAPGHNARSCDVDYDGKEEIIAQHIVKYTGIGTSPDNYQILWGMLLRTNEQAALVTSGTNNQLDIHPDNIRGLDFVKTYVDKLGRVYPAPGVEIFAAPQTGAYESADPSGPIMYRAMAGHMLAQGTEARVWPRKLINLAQTTDGDRYWFPSKSSNPPPQWRQPVSGGSNPSNWDQLGPALDGGLQGDPNVQDVVVGDFLFDPDGAGVDRKPGLELLAMFKKGLSGLVHCGQLRSRTHAIFDATNSLAAVAWGENGFSGPPYQYVVAGPEEDVHPVDLFGDRTSIETLCVLGVNCDASVPIAAHLFRFVKDTALTPRSFRAESLWSTPVWNAPGRRTGFTAGDMFGDSREEVLYLHEPLDTSDIGEVRVVYDSAEAQRLEPSPFAFLDYRRRNQHAGYRDAFDYEPFSGLRFYTQRLLVGKTGSEYGVTQDTALGAGVKGCAVWAEGGKPPYTIQLVKGRLPGGLGASKLRTGVAPYGELYFISGVPVEVGIQRFRLRVTDSKQPTPTVVEQDFWLEVKYDLPPSDEVDSKPSIVRGGFESVFLRVNQPSNVIAHATVFDLDGNTQHVDLFDETGTQVGQLLDNGNAANGDLVAGDGTFSALLAGVTYTEIGPHHFRMVAVDAANNESLPWPYMVVDGGPGDENPTFHDPADLGSQTAANTPVVTEVGFTPDTVPAAETSDASVTLPMTVKLDRKGMKVQQISVRVLHPLTSYQYETVYAVPAAQQEQDVHALTFTGLPAGQFGWGYYTVNVQAVVADTQQVQHVSDWWPRLRVHP